MSDCSLEQPKLLAQELIKASFGHVLAQKTEICRFTLGSALRVHERHNAEEVFPKCPKEHFASLKLRAK